MTPQTPQLYAVAIFVRDLPAALRFYGEALGLPVHRQGEFGAQYFEQEPHLGVHPAHHPNAQAMVGRETGVTIYLPNLVHRAGDLHARGVRFVQEPTKMAFGVMAMVEDPDGNRLALWDPEVPPDEGAPPAP